MTKSIYAIYVVLLLGTTFVHAEDVAKWGLNDSLSNTSASDSINGLNAVAEGTVTFEKAGALSSTGTAAGFDGSSILEVPYNASLNPDGSFSISLWVKTITSGTVQNLVISRTDDANGYIVRINSNDKFRFYVGGGNFNYVEGPVANNNTWQHVLATFQSESLSNGIHTGKAKIYIDGRLYETKTLTYKPNRVATRPLRLGGGGNQDADSSNVNFLTGDLDEIIISNDVKSPIADFADYFINSNGVTRKIFENVNGVKLEPLLQHSGYPAYPDKEDFIQGSFQSPRNIDYNFAASIEAYFEPAVSGTYLFHFSSDDSGELYLSSDRNPLNLTKIASVSGYSTFEEWTKYSSQTSEGINLVAGQKYLLRGIYSEGGGSDHLNVEIQIDGGSQQQIDSGSLSPVLYDIQTNKELLGESITYASQLLAGAQQNIGPNEGQYTPAVIANFEYDISAAQEIYNNVNSNGRQLYAANWHFIDKIKDFTVLSAEKLSGETFGTEPSQYAGREYDKAFDGLTSTFVDSITASGHTGIDLGVGRETILKEIAYFPRSGQLSRMNGGKFQGSLDGVNWLDLYVIPAAPASLDWQYIDLSANSDSYRYYRYYHSSGHTNVAEIEFKAVPVPGLAVLKNKAQSFTYDGLNQTVSSDNLTLSNHRLYPQLISYKLTELPTNGALSINGVSFTEDTNEPGTFLPAFTQADLNSGLLTFSPDGSHTNGSFKFTAEDATGDTLSETTYQIIIDSDFDTIDDTTEIDGGITSWDKSDTDGDGESDSWEITNGTDPNTNSLTPAVDTLQGENGIFARYWYDTPGKIAGYNFNKKPQLVKKLTQLNFAGSNSSNAAGSGKKNNVVALLEAWLWVPKAGEYNFDLISDDGSRLIIDGGLIIDNDGANSPRMKSGSKTFSESGFKKLKVEYFQLGGMHTCQLYWQGPGQERKLIPAKYFFLSKPDYDAALLLQDRDGDNLTDIEEDTVTGTDPDKYDTDGDLLSDGSEILKWGTDPLKYDTDEDGISDYDEVMLFRSNPNTADISGFTTLATVNGSDFTGSTGGWYKDGNSAVCGDLRGSVEYDIEVTDAGIYKIEVESAQDNKDSTYNKIPLIFYIDDMFISRNVANGTYGQNVNQNFLTSYLSPGTHKIKIFWDNVRFKQNVKINNLKLIAIEGPDNDQNGVKDWVDYNINEQMTFDLPVDNRISPMTIEGNTRFLNQLSLSADTATISPRRSVLNRWFAKINLDPENPVAVTADWLSGVKTKTRNLVWNQTNLFESDSISVPLGSSLLLNAIPSNNTEGSAVLTIDSVEHNTTLSTPFQKLFDTAGEYVITGVYTDDQGIESTASITVKVVTPVSEDKLNIWISRQRLWSPSLSSEMVIDAPEVEFTDNGDGTFNITRNEMFEDVNILVRLGDNGPILSSIPTHVFALVKTVDGKIPIDTVFEDGTLLAYDTLIGINLPDDIDLRYYITASGVAFEDGSNNINLTSNSFNSIGTVRVGLLRLPSRTGSFCTKFEIKQGSIILGTK